MEDEGKKKGVGPRADATFKPPAGYRHPSFYPQKEPLTRKRTVGITLGVLGVAAVGMAAFSGKDVQRNSYNSLEDCERDYATGQCSQDRSVSGGYGGGGGGYHYYGPWYRSDWRNGPRAGDPGPGRSTASMGGFTGHGPTGFDFGSRGGFGSTGHVSARGG